MSRAGKRVIEYMEWGGREGWGKRTAEIRICIGIGKGVAVAASFFDKRCVRALWGRNLLLNGCMFCAVHKDILFFVLLW